MIDVAFWKKPPVRFEMPPDEVHLWKASFSLLEKEVAELRAYLPEQEILDSEQFISGALKMRHILSRGFLRKILGSYLGADPVSLEFFKNRSGKPFLSGSYARSLFFNLSHSGNIILLGIAKKPGIGVDVELRREIGNPEWIAGRLFSETEKLAFFSAKKNRMKFFFNLWTQKEAQSKCLGKGLFQADDAAVEETDDCLKGIEEVEPADDRIHRIQLKQIRVAAGYSGAVAVCGHAGTFRFYRWQ